MNEYSFPSRCRWEWEQRQVSRQYLKAAEKDTRDAGRTPGIVTDPPSTAEVLQVDAACAL